MFHQVDDDHEYLEIKEDKIRYRKDRAKRLVDNYCSSINISHIEQLKGNHDHIKELALKLKDESGLSGRQVAKLIGISESGLRKISK